MNLLTFLLDAAAEGAGNAAGNGTTTATNPLAGLAMPALNLLYVKSMC